ncbi:hypothetical protein ACF09H_16570 [Streptomyces sp. NPDC014983]
MTYRDGGGGWVRMAFMPLVWIALLGWAVLRLTRHHGGRDERAWPPRERP